MGKPAFAPFTAFDGKVFHNADFRNAEFIDKVSFKNAQFTGKTDFRGAKFNGVGDFTGARFLGDVDFSDGTFTEPLHFDKIKFAGRTNFSGVHFRHDAHFSETEFAGDSDFSKATFHAWGLFNKSIFKAGMTFEESCFLGSANFAEVDFAILSPPQGQQGLAPFIRFESVELHDPGKIRFSNISFEQITLMGTNVRGITLENPKWPRKGLLASTKRAVVFDQIQKEKPDPQKLAQLYRDIRANLKKARMTADLGGLFYSEMEVRRKQRRGSNDRHYFLRRYFSPYTLLWLTCGYGRRPWRLVMTALLAGLIYWGT